MSWTVVALASLAGGALLGSSQVIAWTLAGDGTGAGWSLLYLAAGVVSFGLAGAIAGWRRVNTPLLHGAVAGVGAYVLVGVTGAVRQLAAGETVAWWVAPALALLACSCGAVGGLVAEWAHRRRQRHRQRRARGRTGGRMAPLGESAG